MLRQITYDELGRGKSSSQQTAGLTYAFGYQYNFANSLTKETYPSGRVMTTIYDGANRSKNVAGQFGNATTNYVTAAYHPHGAISALSYGNTVVNVYGYNNRLQMSGESITLNNSDQHYLLTENFVYFGNGNLSSTTEGYGSDVPAAGLSLFTQGYTYDGVNRLKAASDTGGWSRTFNYDAYGNMTALGDSGNTIAVPSANLYNTSTNQITNNGAQYDAAGNQTLVNGNTLAYDAENRQVAAYDPVTHDTEAYSYDGDGRRVQKQETSGGTGTVFVYDAMGRPAAEYFAPGTSNPCTTCYVTADRLGSTRLVTDTTGNVISRHDYLPFGEEIAASSAGRTSQWGADNDNIKQRFTAKERDQESGLDYFGARYYGSALGRFTSADPENVSGLDHMSDPQAWNAYAYVRNNPLRFTDSDGRNYTVCDQDGKNCGDLTDKQFAQYLNGNSNVSKDSTGNLTFYNDNGTYQNIGSASYYNEKDTQAAGFLTYQVARIGDALGNALKFGASLAFPVTNVLVDATLAIDGRSKSATQQAGFAPVSQKIAQQMRERGWTEQQIQEALDSGPGIPAMGKQGPATRYVNPTTGKSIVVDNATGEVFHVGDEGFNYSDFDLRTPPEP